MDCRKEASPFELAELPAGELSRVLRGRSEAGAGIESSAGAAGAGLCARPQAPVLLPGAMPACAAESPAPQLAAPGERCVARQDASQSESPPASALHIRPNTPVRTPLRN